MAKKSRQRQKNFRPTVQRTGLVAAFFLVFVLSASAYQSPAVMSLFHAVQNGTALNIATGKTAKPAMDFDDDADQDAKARLVDAGKGEALKPEDEDKGGDDSLKFKKREYAFRAYPNKTIPAGARERAWEQFQQHYPANQKKSWWKPVKQVAK